MITEIKKQKLSELQALSTEIEAILKGYQQLLEYNNRNVAEVNELQSKLNDYNFFQKLFSKEYKNIENQWKELPAKNYESFSKNMEKFKMKLTNIIKEQGNIFGELSVTDIEYNCRECLKKIEKEVENIKSKKTIKDFNMSFEEARDFLLKNNLPFYLDESDKVIIENPISFDSLNNFVLVHKTNYLPNNDRISTSEEVGAKHKDIILDRLGSVQYASARNTVHFAVNGEVSSHIYGNWEDCKYAIIVPFPDMPICQLKSGAVMDTFFEGGISLSENSILLCPIEEVEQAISQNNKLKVCGYQGKNVTDYADALVGMLGKKLKRLGCIPG